MRETPVATRGTARTRVRAEVLAWVLGLGALVGGCLALVVGLLSVWMLDDDVAFRMTRADWVVEGARRFGVALLVAMVFGLAAGLAHRRWVVVPTSGVWLRWLPAGLGGCIALAGAMGAAYFVITKPFV